MGLLSQFSSKAEMHRRETIKRFDDFIGLYLGELENVDRPTDEALRVTLVARSPESPVAAAILRHGERLALLGCEVRMVFASVDPASELGDFIELAQICNGDNSVVGSLRWARNPALLDAHEQMVLGTGRCWSGDSMRRSSDSRFALDMFNEDGGAAVDWALMAFGGLWSASALVPRARFGAMGASRNDGGVSGFDAPHDAGFQDISLASAFETRH